MRYPSTIREFEAKFPDFEKRTFKSFATCSASKWRSKQLEAYRVLLIPAGDRLPRLDPYLRSAKSRFRKSALWKLFGQLSGQQTISMDRITLAAEVPELAAFHDALADVLIKPKQPTHEYPKRDRKQTSHPNFQSGAGLGLSSSPERDVPSSPPSEHRPADDERTDSDSDVDEAKGEDVVVHLAAQFLKTVARSARAADPEADDGDGAISFGFSPRHVTFDVNSFAYKYTAVNDGTMVMYHMLDVLEEMADATPNCSLEAKVRGKVTVDDAEEALPTLSNCALAQCFGQMVGMVHKKVQESTKPLTEHELT